MPRHYDLHAWIIYQPNPKGVFAQWNPAGSCGTVVTAAHTGHTGPLPVGGAALGVGSSAERDGDWWFAFGAVAASVGAAFVVLGTRVRRAARPTVPG